MKIPSLALALAAAALLGNTAVRAADEPALMEPVKSVLTHYLTIQTNLSTDTFKGVDEQANAIASAVKGDSMKMLSPDVAKQAETLAQASSIWRTKRPAKAFITKSIVRWPTPVGCNWARTSETRTTAKTCSPAGRSRIKDKL